VTFLHPVKLTKTNRHFCFQKQILKMADTELFIQTMKEYPTNIAVVGQGQRR
jgi:hypothetical protein